MKPAPFDYHAPRSLAEAASLLAELEDSDPKVLAGGQSLVPLMNLRLARPGSLVDLNRVEALTGITCVEGEWHLRALTRHAAVEDSAELAARLPLLPAAARHIGYRAIRHRGTVGGSVCHGDPAAEWPLLTRLLDAQLDLTSASGTRSVPAESFYEGYFTTAVAPEEILTGVRFAQPAEAWRWGFSEFARKVGDFAVVAVGAVLELADDGAVAHARLAVAGAASVPLRLDDAEAALVGVGPDDATARDKAVAAALETVAPAADAHGSTDFKRRLVGVQLRRALEQASGREQAR